MNKHTIIPLLLALAWSLGACTPPAPDPAPAAPDTLAQPAPPPPPVDTVQVTYEGVDVSHYQGTVDWAAVRAAGITYAIAKATEGLTEVDPQFTTNWADIKQAGLVRGAYHFFDPGDDPMAQAQHFIATVNLEPGDLPPVLDVETQGTLTNEELNAAVQTWLETVQAAYKVPPILYTDLSYARTKLADPLATYPLWIAEYADTAPTDLGPWSNWMFWQYSQSGTVDGVDGAVDRDRYQGTATAWVDLRIK